MSVGELSHASGWPEPLIWIFVVVFGVQIVEAVIHAVRGAMRMNREEKTIPQDRDRNWQQQDGRDVIDRAKRGQLPPPPAKGRK